MEDARSQHWRALWDAERVSRYYTKLADRNKKWHTFLSILTMVLSLVAAVTLFIPVEGDWIPYATALLFLAVSSLTAVMFVCDFSGRAQTARIVGDQVREICLELKQAWYKGPELISREDVSRLERRFHAITRVDLTIDDNLNIRCANDANKVLRNEFFPREAGTTATADS